MVRTDVDALVRARGRWAVTIQGREYISRPIGSEQVASFFDAMRGATSGRQVTRAVRAFLRLAFPWTLAYRWRGDPVEQLLALSPPVRKEVLQDFFRFAGVLAPQPPASSTPTTASTTTPATPPDPAAGSPSPSPVGDVS